MKNVNTIFACKRVLLLIMVIVSTVQLSAQPAFLFSYDDAGNRIKRELIDLSDPDPGEEPGPEGSVQNNLVSTTDQQGHSDQEMVAPQDETSLFQKAIDIYPNPVKDELSIEFAGYSEEEGGTIVLVSPSGSVISVKSKSMSTEIIQMQNMAPGYYILKVSIEDEVREWVVLKD